MASKLIDDPLWFNFSTRDSRVLYFWLQIGVDTGHVKV